MKNNKPKSDCRISLALPTKMKTDIIAAATHDGRSSSSWIRLRLQEALVGAPRAKPKSKRTAA